MVCGEEAALSATVIVATGVACEPAVNVTPILHVAPLASSAGQVLDALKSPAFWLIVAITGCVRLALPAFSKETV